MLPIAPPLDAKPGDARPFGTLHRLVAGAKACQCRIAHVWRRPSVAAHERRRPVIVSGVISNRCRNQAGIVSRNNIISSSTHQFV